MIEQINMMTRTNQDVFIPENTQQEEYIWVNKLNEQAGPNNYYQIKDPFINVDIAELVGMDDIFEKYNPIKGIE